MKLARTTLSWNRSVSMDVVGVNVAVTADGAPEFEASLSPDIESVLIGDYREHQMLQAVFKVSDGVHETEVSSSWQVPDLESPQPVTNVAFSYIVIDTETPVEPEPEEDL